MKVTDSERRTVAGRGSGGGSGGRRGVGDGDDNSSNSDTVISIISLGGTNNSVAICHPTKVSLLLFYGSFTFPLCYVGLKAIKCLKYSTHML